MGIGSTKLRYKTRDVMRKDPVKAGIGTFDQHDFVKQIQIVNIAVRIQIYRIGRNRLVCNQIRPADLKGRDIGTCCITRQLRQPD